MPSTRPSAVRFRPKVSSDAARAVEGEACQEEAVLFGHGNCSKSFVWWLQWIWRTEHATDVSLAAVVPAEATIARATTVKATMMDSSEGMEIEKDVREISAQIECRGHGHGQG